MDSKLVAALVAGFISLLLEVVPGFTDLWAKVSTKYKPLVMLGLCLVMPFALAGLACVGVDIGLGVACPVWSAQVVFDYLAVGGAAFVGSQASFAVLGAGLGERVK